MKTFEQRKAEIFRRAEKQKQKEKQVRKRVLGSGIVLGLCLCITVGVVLRTPELSEDMITDAGSKGNAPAPGESADGDTQKEESVSFDGIASVPENGVGDEDCEPVSESDELYCSEEAASDDEMDPEEVASEFPFEKEENDKLYEYLGKELALLRVGDTHYDYLYDDFGNVLLAECDVLYMASNGKKEERIKLVLPLSYAEQVANGDTLVVLLSEDDVHDTLLRDDAVCILGKSEDLFEELAEIGDFSADMTAEEALVFFESFSK